MNSVTGTVSFEDHLHAQRVHRSGKAAWLQAVCAVAALLGGIVLWRMPGQGLLGAMLLGGGLGGVVGELATSRLYLPWKVQRLHRQQKALADTFIYSWDESALHAASPHGQATRPWAHYVKVKEGERIFLLYHADHMFEMLPKRWFSEAGQLEAFRRSMQAVPRA